MFNSTILDVAAGVIFGFLAVSLFTSASVEAINSLLKLRSRSLLSGIKALVNDPNFTGLARDLYQHAAISPRGPGGEQVLKRFPAYVDSMQFAAALLDVTGLSAASATEAAQAPGPKAVAELKARLGSIKNPQLEQLLGGIVERSGGDLQRVEADVAAWFDNGMDRVSGTFKRWTQLATFAIALAIAMAINVDAIRLATLLWEQPLLAARIQASATLPPTAASGVATTEEDAVAALTTVLQAGLPVGWAADHFMQASDGHGHWQSVWRMTTLPWTLLGWFVTAIAALFGAPFWFDTLQTVVRLKGSGPSPAEAASGRAAPR